MLKKRKKVNKQISSSQKWVINHYGQIATFNLVLILLVLLKSAGYFAPYFPISINLTVFISIILGITLLELNYKSIFIIAIIFWLFSLMLSFFGLNVWSERSGIYTFEAILLGTVLILSENSNFMVYFNKLYQKLKKITISS